MSMRAPLFIVAILASAVAHCQTRYEVLTIDWLTASSDVVVLGTARQVESNRTVQIDIKETFKGDFKPPLVVPAPASDSDGLQFWFLRRSGDGFEKPRVVKPLIKDSHLGYFTQALAIIRTEEEIAKAVRETISRVPGRIDESLQLEIPNYIAFRTGRMEATNLLVVPLSPDIELLARAWTEPASQPWQRKLGVETLAHFKSPANAAFLRAILQVPPMDTSSSRQPDSSAHAAAERVLREWGMEAELPPLDTSPHKPSARPIRVEVDGVEVSFKGVSAPRIINGRVYARACTISKPLNAVMGFYDLFTAKGIQIDAPGRKIRMPIDSHLIWVNDQIEEVPFTAQKIGYEGFFPVRYIAEKLGATVKWDPAKNLVIIQTAKLGGA